jgi:enamine deaminase RidA (YjgF/YER057c/UK114 family)
VSAERRLVELGIELPASAAPVANYVPAVRTGSLLFVSGHGPIRLDGTLIVGKVGADLDLDAAQTAARVVGLNLLATMRQELGSLDEVSRIVKVLGMVNATPGFTQIPAVIDGCSDLLVSVFGDCGRHARSAVGMGELPFGISVEIELVAEVRRPVGH